MAVLNKEEFMSRLQERIGEDTSDEAMAFIEDMTDTFNDMETRLSGNNDEQWKQKYDELDKAWRKKYTDRFFNSEKSPADDEGKQEEDVQDDAEEKTYADLFEEREG